MPHTSVAHTQRPAHSNRTFHRKGGRTRSLPSPEPPAPSPRSRREHPQLLAHRLYLFSLSERKPTPGNGSKPKTRKRASDEPSSPRQRHPQTHRSPRSSQLPRDVLKQVLNRVTLVGAHTPPTPNSDVLEKSVGTSATCSDLTPDRPSGVLRFDSFNPLGSAPAPART